ncbi:hypothetical protein [Trichormus sp. NMC-1]|nr:hypothetical protein [Trichormus sp. NMC-1]
MKDARLIPKEHFKFILNTKTKTIEIIYTDDGTGGSFWEVRKCKK